MAKERAAALSSDCRKTHNRPPASANSASLVRGKWAVAQGLGNLPLKPRQKAVPPARPLFATFFDRTEAFRIIRKALYWRSGWDSNPRRLAPQLISSQSRYDHFDTAPEPKNSIPWAAKDCKGGFSGKKRRQGTLTSQNGFIMEFYRPYRKNKIEIIKGRIFLRIWV